MPHSYSVYEPIIVEWVKTNIPPGGAILDLGAGSGKFGTLLRPSHDRIDAVEIWWPYVVEYDLCRKYRFVTVADARWFYVPPQVGVYSLVLMGDILEHLSVADALAVLDRWTCPILVQVPFRYAQGEVGGNPHERHLQDDLTPEIMAERYPMLQRMPPMNGSAGLYLKQGEQ